MGGVSRLSRRDEAPDSKVIKEAGTSETESGLKLRGVEVTFDETTNQFIVTSPTTGAGSVIDIVKIAETTGDKTEVPELFGFANTTRAVGVTNPWVNLSQHTVNGTQTFVELGDDGYYEEVTDPSGVDSTINAETWKPVFLDPGELTFTLNGEALSPFMGIPFTAKLVAGQDTNIPISMEGFSIPPWAVKLGRLEFFTDGVGMCPEICYLHLHRSNSCIHIFV